MSDKIQTKQEMAFSSISDLWNKWNIRSFVLLSLSLQVFLILFSPIRKKTANKHIIFLLWLAYLMADWVAAFTIGLISQNQGNAHASEVDEALQAFWASFLLLHIGGPDTITAFSLEDSSLWRRHLLGLIFQIGTAIYVFAQIFPSDKLLMTPTMLVFLVGVIKNVERTLALYLSSLPSLRESIISPWQEAVICLDNVRFTQFRDPQAGIGYLADQAIRHFEPYEANYNESTVVELAYCFFEIFKVFLGDLMFTRRERELSRDYFALMSAMDMLRVISVELQFIYEVLHTKALAIRSKLSYIFRFISFMGVVVALVLFNRLKKHQPSTVDMKITYILLFGGIVLDAIALFMLIFSDWRLAEIMLNNFLSSELCSHLYDLAYDTHEEPRLATYKANPNADVTHEALDTPIIFRRWSESISACNLLSMSLNKRPRKMYKFDPISGRIASSEDFDFLDFLDFPFYMVKNIISYYHQASKTIAEGCGLETTEGYIAVIADTMNVSKNPFLKRLWIFIVEELRCKSTSMCALRERKLNELEQRRHDLGITDWMIMDVPRRPELMNINEPIEADRIAEVKGIFEARGELFLQSLNFNYDDLQDFIRANYDRCIIMWHIATEIWYNIEQITEETDKREFSKILSDYMLYLFLNQSNVVSTVVGIAQMIAGETLKDLRDVLDDHRDIHDVEALCQLLSANPQAFVLPRQRSKSVLQQGVQLAQNMARLHGRKWEVMSGVWVEMLSYAAIHVKGEAHVQVLSKGGELLTFVWLLMAHFGCVYSPELGIYNAI